MNRLNNTDKLNKKYSFAAYFMLLPLIFLLSISSYSQNNIERYNIGKIEVTGNTSFSPIADHDILGKLKKIQFLITLYIHVQ